jgi:predicted nucleic acid-binding Zn ribbon protein
LGKEGGPAWLGDALRSFLDQRGLTQRVEQAAVLEEWPQLVGATVARVTVPLSVSADGTLFVAVQTSAWMNELSLLEGEILAAIRRGLPKAAIRRIRWQLAR